MSKLLITAVGALGLVAVSGCEPVVHGSGVFGEEVRTVPPFDGVSIGLEIQATVHAGAPTQSVILSGDENVLPYVATRVVDGVLETALTGTGRIESVHPLGLAIEAPTVDRIIAWDEAVVDASGVDADAFTVNARGGSVVTLAGADGAVASSLSVTAEGPSVVDAAAFPAQGADVTLTNGAHADLTVSGAVTGAISGGSALTVRGGGSCAVTVSSGASCQVVP